VYDMQTVLISI